MDSALSPREIQARVRAGATLDEVASEAGVPVEKVEPFASPVFAERAHVAGTAQQSPVRRAGEPGPHPMLRQVVAPVFARLGVPTDSLVWDAWRNDDRRWTVRVTWHDNTSEGDQTTSADFLFDQNSRFSIAADQAARDLIGERPTPTPDAATDPDNEPTIDLDDELALVRATQPALGRGRRPRVVPEAPVMGFYSSRDSRHDAADSSAGGVDMEFSEVDLVEVDGVYDFVPGSSQLDMLYDMLSGINEDSVNIYEGLQPIPTADPSDAQPDPAQPSYAIVPSRLCSGFLLPRC